MWQLYMGTITANYEDNCPFTGNRPAIGDLPYLAAIGADGVYFEMAGAVSLGTVTAAPLCRKRLRPDGRHFRSRRMPTRSFHPSRPASA
jgi:hypothetical protein